MQNGAPIEAMPLGAAVAPALSSSPPSSNASTTAGASSAEAVRGTLSEVRGRPLPEGGKQGAASSGAAQHGRSAQAPAD